jgi:hypothetical protein
MVFRGQIPWRDSRQKTDICVPHGIVDRESREGFPNSLLVSPFLNRKSSYAVEHYTSLGMFQVFWSARNDLVGKTIFYIE